MIGDISIYIGIALINLFTFFLPTANTTTTTNYTTYINNIESYLTNYGWLFPVELFIAFTSIIITIEFSFLFYRGMLRIITIFRG